LGAYIPRLSHETLQISDKLIIVDLADHHIFADARRIAVALLSARVMRLAPHVEGVWLKMDMILVDAVVWVGAVAPVACMIHAARTVWVTVGLCQDSLEEVLLRALGNGYSARGGKAHVKWLVAVLAFPA